MRYFLLAFFSIYTSLLFAQQADYNTRVNNYIQQYKDIAIEEMNRVHIPASITLAQGILESDAGQSPLATDANNHFGIKCHENWNGGSYRMDDDERDECFRKYASAQESYKDHSDFLRNRDRYSFLFKYDANDYKDWAFGLKKAGYATNPHYAQLLINNIEKYKLYEFDKPAIDNPVKDTITPAIAAAPATKDSLYLPKADDIGARIFYVNRVRAVKLLPGETLEQVGKRFDIGLRRVLKYNDWTVTHKEPAGSIIYLQPKRRGGDSLYHLVQNNETMHDIAQQHAITLESLYHFNRMEDGTEPANGEVIYLQGERNTKIKLRQKEEPKEQVVIEPLQVPEQPVDSSANYITIPEDYKFYTVKPGDTLYSIAKAYRMNIERLKEMNKLYSDVISSGMRLKVSE